MPMIIRRTITADLQKRPMSMKQLFFASVCGMAALFASSCLASAQAAAATAKAAGQGQNAPDQFQVQVYAPSDLAVSPSGAGRSHGSQRGAGVRTSVAARTGSEPAHSGANIPRLCFQPGIGWISTSSKSNGKASGQGNPEGSPAVSPHLRAQHSAGGDDCSMPQVQATSSSELANGNSLFEIKSSGLSSDANPSSFNSLSTSLAADSFSRGRGDGVPDLRKGSGIHDPTDPASALDQLKALRRRAYISPVRLRRMARNAPDLRTRLELRQMNSEVESRAAASHVTQSGNTLAGTGNTSVRKAAGRQGRLAKKSDCERKAGSSKSKVCAQFKH